MKLAVINTEPVLRDHYVPEAYLIAEDGKIASFGEMRNAPDFTGCEIREGLRADLIIVDHKLNLSHVILKGELKKQ